MNPFDDLIEALPRVVPLVDVPEWISTEGDDPVTRPLAEDLVIMYGRDSDEIAFASDLMRQGVSPDRLHEIALSNLHRENAAPVRIVTHGPVFSVITERIPVSTLLVDDGFWDRNSLDLAPNGVVAAVPTDSILLVTDARSVEGIAQMRRYIEDLSVFYEFERLSRNLYKREANEWRVC